MKILYTTVDGKIAIVHAAPKEHLERVLGPLTEQAYKNHVWERSIPANAIGPREIDESEIPASREFRDAWTVENDTIKEDLDKSREIKLKQIREERKPLFEANDAALLKALSMDDAIALSAAKEEAQRLRDATEPLKTMEVVSIDQLAGTNLDTFLGK